jgi:hypothetical protein
VLELMSDPRSLLAAALAAAERGWPVFLLGRSKRPLANCPQCPKQNQPGAHAPEDCRCGVVTCHGFYAATTDAARLVAIVAAHPDGLLAVRCGAAPDGAGVVVVDIDPRNGGRLDPALMTPTLTAASGNHGWHLYYRHPGDRQVLSRKLDGTIGVDVKADGGYVVLPPSVHPATRRRYRWANTRLVEEMPPRLAEMVLAPPAAPGSPIRACAAGPAGRRPLSARPGSAGVERVRHPGRLVETCIAKVRDAPEGRRRVTLYGAARGVARAIHHGFDHTTGVALLVEAGRDAEQSERDIHAAIAGGFAAEGLIYP